METDALKALARSLLEEHDRLERYVGDLVSENQRLRSGRPGEDLKPRAPRCIMSLDKDDTPKERASPRVTAPRSPRAVLSPRTLPIESRLERAQSVASCIVDYDSRPERAGSLFSLRTPSMLPLSLPMVWPEWKAPQADMEDAEEESYITEKTPTGRGILDVDKKEKSGGRLLSESALARSLVQHPGSNTRTIWDLFSTLIIGYDLVVVPLVLGGFAVPDSDEVFGVIDICTSCFWLLDIVMSFLTGFFTGGLVEMRVDKIAIKYFKGWFTFDLVVVSIDWVFIFIGGSTLLRLGKSKRLLRLIRTLRIVRSIKMTVKLSQLLDSLRSEGLRILFSTMALALFVLTLNHYFACGWYYVGTTSDAMHNWVLANVEAEPIGMQYVTALHWSFTQFTPAGMEIHPNNFAERLYTVVTVFFAMITFSSFMGSITANMNALRKLTSEPAKVQKLLHEYFTDNGVSAELGTRIWGYLKKNHFEHRMCALRKDIQVLKFLPPSMSADLNEELYVPCLKSCPFFLQYGIIHYHGLRAICDSVVTERTCILGERLFQSGTQAENMYFVTMGRLHYEHRDPRLTTKLGRHQWASEPTLWMKWYHCGTMDSQTSCAVLCVAAKRFRTVVSDQPRALTYVRSYIALFRDLMSDPEANEANTWKTDIWLQVATLKHIVLESLPEPDFPEQDSKNTWFRKTSGDGASPDGKRAV